MIATLRSLSAANPIVPDPGLDRGLQMTGWSIGPLALHIQKTQRHTHQREGNIDFGHQTLKVVYPPF
ncbi:MAG: hypothetical protein GY736_04120 [Sphingomonas sp.]|jgi:hypothetical protein|uniref:hypothetical protein n=1 Tax=unclassified Sphingomonas TaxID=196159 RepID=UPI0018DFD67D|nr:MULTISPECIES: hypothetical protein [unclassified Sphingomonas]MCP4025486.1 hypothetical protein [Sphingomonas sp.]